MKVSAKIQNVQWLLNKTVENFHEKVRRGQNVKINKFDTLKLRKILQIILSFIFAFCSSFAFYCPFTFSLSNIFVRLWFNRYEMKASFTHIYFKRRNSCLLTSKCMCV